VNSPFRVPIAWLDKAGLIARTVDAIGVQLRLPLKIAGRPVLRPERLTG
jgi:hypothetical protein